MQHPGILGIAASGGDVGVRPWAEWRQRLHFAGNTASHDLDCKTSFSSLPPFDVWTQEDLR